MACLGEEVVKEKTFYLRFIQVAIHFTIAKGTCAYKVQASSGTNIASLIFILELNVLKRKKKEVVGTFDKIGYSQVCSFCRHGEKFLYETSIFTHRG